jgi:FkbM family methyltransferase
VIKRILNRFKGYPKALVFVFHLANSITSILLQRIIGVEHFVKKRKILSSLVYRPLKLISRDIILYNGRYDYYFVLNDTSSYGVMMLSHEGDVPFMIYSLLRRMKDPVFIDVGAHLGAYTLAFSKISKLVVAVEPNPVNYLILRKNLAINKIKNCMPVKCAISNYVGTAYLYVSEFSDLHSLHKNRLDKAMYVVPVRTTTLDTLALRELKLSKIDLVKIDAEGAEVEILEGMGETMERYGPILIVEVFQRNIEKTLGVLRKYRYNVIRSIYQSTDPLTKENYIYIMAAKSGAVQLLIGPPHQDL